MRHHDYTLFRRKGSKTWYFYYFKGNERLAKSTGKSLKYEAEQEARKFVDKGKLPDISLNDFSKDFFVWDRCSWIKRQHSKGRSFSKQVAHGRRAHLKNHILPEFGKYYLTELNKRSIEDWLTSQTISNQTKNHILYSFRIVLRDAEDAGLLEKNVLDRVEPFGNEAKKRDVFSVEDLKQLFPDDREKLLEIWGSLKHATCYIVLASTGIRTGEVRALQWLHNISDGALLIDRAVKADGSIGTTKSKDVRIVLLPAKVQRLLNEWLKETPFSENVDLIFFGNAKDKPWSRDYLSKYFHPCMGRAKIDTTGKNIVCHSFRHTFNTVMRQVLPLEILQALTGHKSESMTDLYDHPSIEARLNKLEGSRRLIESIWN